MKSEALFPNHKNMDLPFVIHAVGAAQKQARRKRDEGAVNTQVIYGAQGEGRLLLPAQGRSARLLAPHPGLADELALL